MRTNRGVVVVVAVLVTVMGSGLAVAMDKTSQNETVFGLGVAARGPISESAVAKTLIAACVDPDCATTSSCMNALISPQDGGTVSSTRPTVSWQCVNSAYTYNVRMRECPVLDECGPWFTYCSTTSGAAAPQTSCSASDVTLKEEYAYVVQVETWLVTYPYDPCCYSTTAWFTIEAKEPPVAEFTWDPLRPTVGERVHFIDGSTNDPDEWFWTFGDGGASESQNPYHRFEERGLYVVTLKTVNDAGSDSASHQVVVGGNVEPVPREEVQLSTPGAAVGGNVDVATDRAGRRVFVWREAAAAKAEGPPWAVSNGAGNGIVGQLFGAGDEAEGDPIDVDGDETVAGRDPTVDFDGDGRFVVTWDTELKSGGNEVLGRVFGSDGTAETTAFQVSDGGGGGDAVVASGSSGEFMVTWSQSASAAASSTGARGALAADDEVWGRRFSADGTPQSDPFPVGGGDGEEVTEASTASDASGNTVVVYGSSGGAAAHRKGLQDGSGIVAQFYPPGSTTATETEQANTVEEGETSDASVASGATGTTVVVWAQDRGDGNGNDIYGRIYDADCVPAGGQFLVNASQAGEQTEPAVGANAEGDFVVAWESQSGSKADGGTEIWGRIFSGDGVPVTSDFEVKSSEEGLEPQGPGVSISSDDSVTVTYTLEDDSGNGVSVNFVTFDVESPSTACSAGPTTLCLNEDRFKVEVAWRDFQNRSGMGQAEQLTSDTGYFWFFKNTNVELIIKVLDGTSLNGYFWVFYGALSNVEYTVTVTDTETGNSAVYYNPSANLASVGDTSAIPAAKSAGAPVMVTKQVTWGRVDFDVLRLVSELAAIDVEVLGSTWSAGCTTGTHNLCLNKSRFKVEVDWRDFEGDTGTGAAWPLTTDTGYFWFFKSTNVELVIKVLDGRPVNGRFWVFYGALSNVEFTVTVTDTESGAVVTYENPLGEFGSVADTSAF